MSYTRQVDDMTINVICKADPENNYNKYFQDIANRIINSGYKVKTTLENLITMIVLHFDCDDNYGKYDPETGCGGYGDEFTLDKCFEYVEHSGGFSEFDYYC